MLAFDFRVFSTIDTFNCYYMSLWLLHLSLYCLFLPTFPDVKSSGRNNAFNYNVVPLEKCHLPFGAVYG